MNIIKLLIIALFLILISSCKNDQRKKVSFDNLEDEEVIDITEIIEEEYLE